MPDQSSEYSRCTVVVSSFSPNASVDVIADGAKWWMYAGEASWAGCTKFFLSSVPLALRSFNMTDSILTFGFSEATNLHNPSMTVANRRNANDDGQSVVAPTFTLDVYLRKDVNDAYISAQCGASAIVGFTFDGVTWYSIDETPTKVDWP
jgi:hypothetical protein